MGTSRRVCAEKQWVDDEDEGYGASKEEVGGVMNPIPRLNQPMMLGICQRNG
ncbi:hypothetical protein V8C34DRAFT_270054 [Trichoderma compactum]